MKTRTLGQMVRDARKVRGWTQEEMAELTGVSRSTIANIEAGSTKLPGRETLEKLEQHLGLTKEEMMRGAGRLDRPQDADLNAVVKRIKAIPDLGEQMDALDDLPPDLYELVEIMAHRLLRERLRRQDGR